MSLRISNGFVSASQFFDVVGGGVVLADDYVLGESGENQLETAQVWQYPLPHAQRNSHGRYSRASFMREKLSKLFGNRNGCKERFTWGHGEVASFPGSDEFGIEEAPEGGQVCTSVGRGEGRWGS